MPVARHGRVLNLGVLHVLVPNGVGKRLRPAMTHALRPVLFGFVGLDQPLGLRFWFASLGLGAGRSPPPSRWQSNRNRSPSLRVPSRRSRTCRPQRVRHRRPEPFANAIWHEHVEEDAEVQHPAIGGNGHGEVAWDEDDGNHEFDDAFARLDEEPEILKPLEDSQGQQAATCRRLVDTSALLAVMPARKAFGRWPWFGPQIRPG